MTSDVVEAVVVLAVTGVLLVFLPFNGYVARRLGVAADVPPEIAALTIASKVSRRIFLAVALWALVAVHALVLLIWHVRLLPMAATLLLLAAGIVVASTANLTMLRQLRRWDAEERAFRIHSRAADARVTPHRRNGDPPGPELGS